MSEEEPYSVMVEKSAKRYLEHLPKEMQQAIHQRMKELTRPFSVPNLRKIRKYDKTYRTRVGDYRIIFVVDKKKELFL